VKAETLTYRALEDGSGVKLHGLLEQTCV